MKTLQGFLFLHLDQPVFVALVRPLCDNSAGFAPSLGALAQPPDNSQGFGHNTKRACPTFLGELLRLWSHCWRRSLNLLRGAPRESAATGGARSTSFRKLLALWLPLKALAQPPLQKLRRLRLPLEALAQPPSQSSSELAGGGACSTSFRKLLALWLPLEALAQPPLAALPHANARSTSFGELLGDGWRRCSLNLLQKAPRASAAAGGARSTSFTQLLGVEALAAAGGARSTSFGELLGDGWRRCSLNLQKAPRALAAAGGARSTSFAKAPHRLPLEEHNLLRGAPWSWLDVALAQPPSESSLRLAAAGALAQLPWRWLEAALRGPIRHCAA